MASARDAILSGSKAAHTLHRDLGLKEALEREGGGRMDVFGSIAKLGATLMFQPLDKLLGAYVPSEENGILITTKRGLPVQRFTGAHELGHLYMSHQPSFDDDGILRRAPFSTKSQTGYQEQEADAFASMFLAPGWLLALIVERQKWPASCLDNPNVVYQLSLRLGTSYSATCYVLERHRAISGSQRLKLLSFEPKQLKKGLLAGYSPPDWRADVWHLTAQDEGTHIEGGRNDLFVVSLEENSSAGYLWSFEELRTAGFALVSDDHIAPDDETVGGIVTRRITARSEGRVNAELTLHESRPWMPGKHLHELHLRCDLRGPEEPGMWEPELQRALQVA